MQSHLTETAGGVIGLLGYCVYQIGISLGFNVVQIDILNTGYDIINKFIGMGFGIATALLSYFVIYLAKKFVTKEIKSTKKK